MESLTKEQRHKIYKRALNLFKEGRSRFMCDCINEAAFPKFEGLKNGGTYDTSWIEKKFPEFIAFRPKKIAEYETGWFDDELRDRRIFILEMCIEKTKP